MTNLCILARNIHSFDDFVPSRLRCNSENTYNYSVNVVWMVTLKVIFQNTRDQIYGHSLHMKNPCIHEEQHL